MKAGVSQTLCFCATLDSSANGHPQVLLAGVMAANAQCRAITPGLTPAVPSDTPLPGRFLSHGPRSDGNLHRLPGAGKRTEASRHRRGWETLAVGFLKLAVQCTWSRGFWENYLVNWTAAVAPHHSLLLSSLMSEIPQKLVEKLSLILVSKSRPIRFHSLINVPL